MGRLFSAEAQAKILQNKNVLKVTERTITYSPDFKVEAVRANLVEGKSPLVIFLDAGFNLNLIGRETPKHCLKDWREIYRRLGEEGLGTDQRGRSSKGRPPMSELTVEEKLRRAEARVKYLEEEVELLKKLDAIERSVVDRPSEKYALIHKAMTAGKRFSVSYLCDVAGVSRSGYYRWLSCGSRRLARDVADNQQHLLIKDIFEKNHRKAGWRVIKMNLERQGIIMNAKKIKRLMKKFGLVAEIRRRNPYKQLAKANQEHRTAPNILERRFDQSVPYKAFGTDITYLYYGNGVRCYLSIILDLASAEIVTYRVSSTLGMELSLDPLTQMVNSLGASKVAGALLHSDQGFHYTNPFFSKQLAVLNIVQSMSRKGNCLDNAPVESFFGHMKDELDLTNCYSLDEVRTVVAVYIYGYNHHRYQWERKKMAPVEYRDHLLAS